MADITYCEYKECPHTDCERHPTKVEQLFKKGVPYVSIYNFKHICSRVGNGLKPAVEGKKKIFPAFRMEDES